MPAAGQPPVTWPVLADHQMNEWPLLLVGIGVGIVLTLIVAWVYGLATRIRALEDRSMGRAMVPEE